MNPRKNIDHLLIHEASQWLEAVRSGEAQNDELHAWLTQSQLHTDAFLKILAVDMELDRAGEHAQQDPKRNFEVAALANLIERSVTPFRSTLHASEAKTSTTRGRWKVASALAAGIAVIAVTTAWLVWNAPSESQKTTVATAANEQRAVVLPDTSRVTLNESSQINVAYSSTTRSIQLRGEGIFKVTRDATRPFIVTTSLARIRAVGTEFNVKERGADGATISVLEGRVQVLTNDGLQSPADDQYLDAGEEAEVLPTGKIHRRLKVNVAHAVAWRARRLPLEGATLEELLQEFNRYSGSHFQIEGPAPTTRYGGIFDATDAQSLADYLSRESDLAVERRGAGFVVRVKPGGAAPSR